MRRFLATVVVLLVLSPDVGAACPSVHWCSPPSGAPTSPLAELQSAVECDTVAATGNATLLRPSAWLRPTRGAGDFREVNEARDYAAQYRVRATRARRAAARLVKMRADRRSERSLEDVLMVWQMRKSS